MKLRKFAALALSLGLSAAATAQQPVQTLPTFTPGVAAPDASANQALADRVAASLRGANLGQGADLNIVTNDGRVELNGMVRTAAQRDQVLGVIRTVPGVTGVQNGLTVALQGEGVAPVAPGTPTLPTQPGVMTGPPVAPQALPQGAPYAGPIPAFGGDPVPGQLAKGFGNNLHDHNPPKMPGYAWPTYAPYNNLSRVAYPQAYPYNAWPFIGPFYPFPKVPLGWRKVSLEWEDGHWYYGRGATSQDYWRVRFW